MQREDAAADALRAVERAPLLTLTLTLTLTVTVTLTPTLTLTLTLTRNALLFANLKRHHDHHEAPEEERLFQSFAEEDVACSN